MEDFEYKHLANTEPIPGYRLLEPLGRGGFGEVWKCEAPGGLLKAIKFVTGGAHALDLDAPADEELRAIQHVKAIRHPFMLTMERVEVVEGGLVIVMELADQSLADVLDAQRAAGKPGIARDALLRYLREAAEVLDVMNSRYELQHLDIKPRNLFLVSNHVKVGDFGLVNTLTPGGRDGAAGPSAVTPLYASPEVFQGRISRHSDQYSLAIVFQELLTGTLPFNGKNSRQLLIQHTQAAPDLSALSQADAAIVARALSKDPDARFPSCSELVNAIASGETEVVSTTIVTNVSANVVETRRNPTARTPRTRTVAVRPPSLPPEVLGGIRVGELVSRTPLTEVWRATDGRGAALLVKVLFGCRGPGDESIARLPTVRDPLLLPIDVLHHAPGRLVLSMPAADRNLREILADFQGRGLTGIPRADLLAHLGVVAEGLHRLADDGLFHLALNPRSLVLEDGRVRLAEFGLSQLVWRPAGQTLAPLGGRYAAPELAAQPGARCDQYSLALIYHELLTGVYPSPSPSPRKGGTPTHLLDRLPESDRGPVAKALHPDPRERWGGVLDFLEALESVAPAGDAPPSPTVAPTRVLPAVGTRPLPAAPDSEVVQMTRFGTSLSADTITQRLDGFRRQWSAEIVSGDPLSVVYNMPTPSSFWQRWTGKRPGLEIRLRITPPDMTAPEGVQLRTELRMELHPRDCSAGQGGALLEAVGPLLVESVRAHLQVNPRGRTQDRVVWHHPIRLCSMLPDGSQGPPIECQGKDLSLNGIGFYLPGPLPSSSVMLHLPRTPQTPLVTVPARIVRVQGCGDGWFEVGAVLLPPDELPPDDELYGDAPEPSPAG